MCIRDRFIFVCKDSEKKQNGKSFCQNYFHPFCVNREWMVKTGRSFGGVNDAFYLPVFFFEQNLQKGHFWPLNFENFPRNNFLDEKTRVFWGFAKWLIASGLTWFWWKSAFVEKKVNAFWKFGVDFWNFGVLTKTRKGAKFEQKTCTKVYHVCKSSSFAARFFIGQRLRKAPKRPFFTQNCFVSVNKIFCEIFWQFWEKKSRQTSPLGGE